MTTCLLIYYTGTFNTRYVTRKLSARLEALGWEVTVYEIDPPKLEKLDLGKYDIIGLGYPIYGYCAPWPFLKFIRHQKFPRGKKVFIYKNSGETETANDASSKYVTRKLDWDGARTRNEYHFLMPYNIHFKYEDNLVQEMLTMDEKLYDILVYEISHDIPNRRPYRLWPLLTECLGLPREWRLTHTSHIQIIDYLLKEFLRKHHSYSGGYLENRACHFKNESIC